MADTLLVDYRYAVDAVLEEYVQSKFIEPSSETRSLPPEEAVYTINESKRPGLEYYKNNCIAHFIPLAATALVILQKDAFQFATRELYESYAFIQTLFSNEFIPSLEIPSEQLVRKSLKTFIDEAAIVPHPTLPETYNVTSAGFRKLKTFSLFLASYLESYLVVATFYKDPEARSMDPRERIKKIQALGAQMHKKNIIERKEALSKLNFMNAVDVFQSNELKKAGHDEGFAFYAGEIEKFLNVLRA